MTLSVPTPKTVRPATKRYVTPAINLDRPAPKTLSKDNCLTFKLRSVPTEEGSTTYELTVGYFKTGTPEELLLFLTSLKKIFVGQNITDGPNRYAIARRLLQGDSLAAFNRAATQHGTETVAHFEDTLKSLKAHVFPRKALANQKRYMRRFLRKPRDLSVREFTTRLVEINEMLNEFPPGANDQKLPDDELMDIAEYAVPATWQRTMLMHNFDPTIHSPQDFIEFCERIEFAEGTENKEAKPQTDSRNRKDGLLRAKSSERGENANGNRKRRSESTKWCALHEVDSHNTGECKVLLNQAKRMRGTWEAYKSGNKNKKSENDQKGKKEEKQAYNAELKKIVRNQLKEMLSTEKSNEESVHDNEHFNLEDFKNIDLSDGEASA